MFLNHRRTLADNLAARFGTYPIWAAPVEGLSATPAVVMYPDNPYVEVADPDTWCTYTGGLEVMVVYSRAGEPGDVLARAESDTPEIIGACHDTDNATWLSMTFQPVNIGGVDYLAAVHTVELSVPMQAAAPVQSSDDDNDDD